MSPLSYAPLRADADDMSTLLPPETLTASTVAAAAVGVGHHLFKVEGYSRLKPMHGDTGSYIESGEFTAGGHTWKVLCYLNGCVEGGAGFISLCVNRTGGGGAGVVHAEEEFELLRPHGAAAEWPPSYGQRGLAAPFDVGQTWGFPKFIAAKDLEGSRFLKDDGFSVRCTVTVVEERGAVEEDVTVEDMDRVGVVCACEDEDEACGFKHERPAQTLWEVMARFSRSFCGEASS
ncbi:unnamed protein product [Urochloa decumbens]|uniref:MATH domain-containing protein n=1 Tax=Urochloa decumbens TaxID=240449 RepID=A0ABC9FM73_9POAL